MKIIKIVDAERIDEAFHVVTDSFATVAEEFGLTRENAPTNPAFITREQFNTYLEKDITLFGLIKDGSLVGCAAIEKSSGKEGCFYIERLAVQPKERHKGYGRRLLDFAIQEIGKREGSRVEIGIINEHSVLKNWYLDYGFSITGVKRFDHLLFEVCFLAMDV